MFWIRHIFALIKPKEIVVYFRHRTRDLLLCFVKALNNLADRFLFASPDQRPLMRYVTERLTFSGGHLLPAVLQAACKCRLGPWLQIAVFGLQQFWRSLDKVSVRVACYRAEQDFLLKRILLIKQFSWSFTKQWKSCGRWLCKNLVLGRDLTTLRWIWTPTVAFIAIGVVKWFDFCKCRFMHAVRLAL